MEKKQNMPAVLSASIAEVNVILELHEESIKHNEDKLVVLDNLKNIDLGSLESFFDEIKKKTETLKTQAIANYGTNYNAILKKISEHTQKLQSSTTICTATLQKLRDLEVNLEKSPELGQFIQAETISDIASTAKKPIIPSRVDDEIELLFSKEEIYSQLGSFSQMLGNLESRLGYFISEHLSTFVTQDNQTRGSKQSTVDNQLSKLDLLKSTNQIFEENLAALMEGTSEYADLGRKPILPQVRYSSNEVYTFDMETQSFANYELFVDNDYQIPFKIFNNSGTTIWKNQLIFFFGGEDPDDKDKTSNRSFCANLTLKNDKNQVLVKEIPRMLFKRQEFSLSAINDSIYLISGYDMNLNKERRVISKCERLHLKSRRFYEIRDINYPRQWSSCVNHNNTHLYVFAGQNPKYMNNFVEKVEKYMAHLNDWSVLKYTILDNFEYEPAIKMGIFKVAENEIAILGGEREGVTMNDYYVFDIKKYMFMKRRPKFLKEDDHFANRNDFGFDENKAFLFSGCFANRIYEIDVSDKANYNFTVKARSILD